MAKLSRQCLQKGGKTQGAADFDRSCSVAAHSPDSVAKKSDLQTNRFVSSQFNRDSWEGQSSCHARQLCYNPTSDCVVDSRETSCQFFVNNPESDPQFGRYLKSSAWIPHATGHSAANITDRFQATNQEEGL